MTNEQAQALGIWTGWEFAACNQCGKPTIIAELHEINGLAVCPRCKHEGERHDRHRDQPQLFDDQASLF